METFMQILHVAGAVIFTVFFFGACVFVHELGHFLAAKFCGLHIDAFSIGFCKIWEKKIGGVAYRIGWLPIGGYCDLPQVDSSENEPKSADGTQLRRAKPLERIITAFMGPFFNILFGLLLGCLVWYYGVPLDSPKMTEITVLEVAPNSPEYRAGLREGDVITKLNGRNFRWTWSEFAKELLFVIGDVDLTVKQPDGERHIVYTPTENPDAPGKLKYEKIAWPFFTPKIPLKLYPEKGSAAEQSGILAGDTLETLNGVRFSDYGELLTYIAYAGDRPLEMKLRRGEKELVLTVTPEVWKLDGKMPDPIYMIGLTFDPEAGSPTVKKLLDTIPAARNAGILPGDIITAVNGKETPDLPSYFMVQKDNLDNPIELTVRRGEKTLQINVVPMKLYPMTIGLSLMLYDHPTPFQQFASMVEMSYKSLRGMVVSAGNTMHLTEKTSSIKGRHMSGPPGIIMNIYRMVKEVSFITGIHFVVMICFALAIFNLLPFPVLDGGHITFALIEIVIRRPLPPQLIRGLSTVFIVLLIGLMLYVSYFDVLRMVPERFRAKIDPIETSGAPSPEEGTPHAP